MPGILQQWICDYPGCGVTFLAENGYSVSVNNNMSGQAPIGGFVYPDNSQYLCCSLNHVYALAEINLAGMKQSVINSAAAANFTLQLDPPPTL